MSKRRMRIGARKYQATFSSHNGKQDTAGQYTYGVSDDWVPVVVGWPVEMVATGGGETLRGRQVTAQTTHVLFGEAFGGEGINAEHRCQIEVNGVTQTFGVVSVLDMDGLDMERRVELKQEQ